MLSKISNTNISFQCAEDEFEITPQHYSFYLDPVERDKQQNITWVGIMKYERNY